MQHEKHFMHYEDELFEKRVVFFCNLFFSGVAIYFLYFLPGLWVQNRFGEKPAMGFLAFQLGATAGLVRRWHDSKFAGSPSEGDILYLRRMEQAKAEKVAREQKAAWAREEADRRAQEEAAAEEAKRVAIRGFSDFCARFHNELMVQQSQIEKRKMNMSCLFKSKLHDCGFQLTVRLSFGSVDYHMRYWSGGYAEREVVATPQTAFETFEARLREVRFPHLERSNASQKAKSQEAKRQSPPPPPSPKQESQPKAGRSLTVFGETIDGNPGRYQLAFDAKTGEPLTQGAKTYVRNFNAVLDSYLSDGNRHGEKAKALRAACSGLKLDGLSPRVKLQKVLTALGVTNDHELEESDWQQTKVAKMPK